MTSRSDEEIRATLRAARGAAEAIEARADAGDALRAAEQQPVVGSDWSAGEAVLSAIEAAQHALGLVQAVVPPGARRMMAAHLADDLAAVVVQARDVVRVAREGARAGDDRPITAPGTATGPATGTVGVQWLPGGDL